jgi:drug/metabolite transporter (DMT)-like permease
MDAADLLPERTALRRGRQASGVDAGTLLRLGALYVCWGTSIPAMKVMVASIPPLAGAAAVFLAAGLLLGAAALRRPRPAARQARRAALTGLLLLGGQGMATVALTEVSASLTAILVASNALWAAIFARFGGALLDRMTVLRLVVGFGGIALVLLSAPGASVGGEPAAVALALLSSVAWALGTVVASSGGALPRDPLVTGSVQLLTGGALLLVLAAVAGQLSAGAWDGASAGSLAAGGYLLALDSLAGFLLYTSLVRTTPLPTVGTYAYVTPVIGVTCGVLLLGEPVSPLAGAGAAVALLAVVAQLRARPATAPA